MTPPLPSPPPGSLFSLTWRLSQVNGVSAAGALAISRAFGSPLDLANAMRQCGTAKEKLDLVQVRQVHARN